MLFWVLVERDYFSFWDAFQLVQAKESLQKLWGKNSHPATTTVTSTTAGEGPGAPQFRCWIIRITPSAAAADELQQYLLKSKIHDPESIISWWKGQRERFPMLPKMTINIYSIARMSSEPDQVFAGTKHVISDKRT